MEVDLGLRLKGFLAVLTVAIWCEVAEESQQAKESRLDQRGLHFLGEFFEPSLEKLVDLGVFFFVCQEHIKLFEYIKEV